MCALIVSMGIKRHIKLELHNSIFFSHKCYKTLNHNNLFQSSIFRNTKNFPMKTGPCRNKQKPGRCHSSRNFLISLYKFLKLRSELALDWYKITFPLLF